MKSQTRRCPCAPGARGGRANDLRGVPPWLRGLAFSALPSAVSLLVVLPLLGAGPLGLGLGARPVPLAGEVLRNALFGVALAASYSLLRVARQRPARAAVADDPLGRPATQPTP